jgi:hypothetical protein
MPFARSIPVSVAMLAAATIGGTAFAHPPAPVDERGRAITGKLHLWMHQAKVPLVAGRVQIRRRSCPGHPGLSGCVFSRRPRIVFMRRGVRDPRRLVYHELGHVFDLRVLNRRERAAFKRIMGIRRRGWFRGGLPPAEWFADGYADCALHRQLRRRARRTEYGYSPTTSQHARVCRLIHNAAAPRGTPPQPPQNPPPVVDSKPPPPEESQPGQGDTCNLVDQLLTDCKPGSPQGSPLALREEPFFTEERRTSRGARSRVRPLAFG